MRRTNRSQIIIIAAAAVAVLIFVCGGSAAVYRMVLPARALTLPPMPTYIYVTPTLAAPLATSAPGQPPTAIPSPTPTFQSFLLWPSFLNPTTVTPAPHSTIIVVTSTPFPSAATATPIQSAATATPLPTAPNCRNILYPVRVGQEWNYLVKANTRSGDARMKIVSVDGNRGIVEVVNQSRGLSGRTAIQCDRDIILNFPALNADILLGSSLNGSMRADYVSGVLAPNEAAFTASNWALSWTSQYLISGSGAVNFRGQTANLSLSPSYMTMTCQTTASGEAAFQSVTVTAGTFRALKVICLGQGQAAGTINGFPAVGWVSAQSTQWFAPYVGLVKMQSDFANIDLFGLTIPLDPNQVKGTVELISYVQAP